MVKKLIIDCDISITEAVNLELVNLNKVSTANGRRNNGLPQKKKESTQVDIGGAYNEYFVPVNEHKKYIRWVERLGFIKSDCFCFALPFILFIDKLDEQVDLK